MQNDFHGKYFLHFSGSLTSDVFLPLKKLWFVKTASLHPVASFPSVEVGIRRMFNIYWVFEGDKEVLKEVSSLIKILKGRVIVIDKENKILHHIVCVFSANFFAGLLFLSQELARKGSGIKDYRVYFPLIKSVVENLEGGKDVKEVLTGPVRRGDLKTIGEHLNFLQKYPEFLRFYKIFSAVLVDMSQDFLDKQTYEKLREMVMLST